MEAFETTLTGSDGSIAGIVTQLSKEAYQFTSLDDALHLTIAKDEDGKWTRLSGSEPYFSGWVDELIENIAAQANIAKPPQKAKTAVMTNAKETAKATTVKTAAVKKNTATASATNTAIKKTKAKPNTDKKTTVAASANKKAKVSSAIAKGK